MSMGPITIFDKSFLQGLGVDEAVWFQNFYRTNITPLFFVETLADLDKEVAAGRTPEQVVGNLAYKTPCLGAMTNVGHLEMCISDLLGQHIEMRRVPVIPLGRRVSAAGKAATIYDQPAEIDAMQRWQRGEFETIEREFARRYRATLGALDLTVAKKVLSTHHGDKLHFTDLAQVKKWTDQLLRIDGRRYQTLVQGLNLLGIPEKFHDKIVARWKAVGGPPIVEFAPYAAHVLSVDLFFNAALASGHIDANRPSNRVDIAYLYYTPFCMIFTSSDRLHARTAPLFLGDDQIFVLGTDLKADLAKLDTHYSAFPPEVRVQGVMRFASNPPTDGEFLTASLWDRFLAGWRVHASEKTKITPEANAKILDQLKPLMDAAKQRPLQESEEADADDRVMVERRVFAKIGKWQIIPPEAEKTANSKQAATAPIDLSLLVRNRTLLRAAKEIFGFDKGRDWLDFKKNISGSEIQKFYAVQAQLWHPKTDWLQVTTPSDGKFRALYRGDMRPEVLVKNLIRATLYFDEICIVDPFHNPWHLKPDYNPIKNPDQFKSDTLKLIWLLRWLNPLIEMGFVTLIPEPGDFYPDLRKKIWQLAKSRMAGAKIAPEDFEEGLRSGRDELRRMIFALPDDELLAVCARAGNRLDENEKAAFLAYARREFNNDPFALEQPMTGGGQLNVFRAGGNLETAMLISRVRRAIIYTTHPPRWQELMSMRDRANEASAAWNRLTLAFNHLEFRFLDGIDAAAAAQIKAERPLAEFRDFLVRFAKAAKELRDPTEITGYVEACVQELPRVHQSVTADLKIIGDSLAREKGEDAVLLPGRLIPNAWSLTPRATSTMDELEETCLRKPHGNQPMSILIDVTAKLGSVG